MQKSKLNNVIVLKDMPSNIVEEAIVVLKPNVNLKLYKNTNDLLQKKKQNNKNNAILKEAEYVIDNSVKQLQIKSEKLENFKTEKRYKILKKVTTILTILNFFLLFKIF